MFRSGTLGYDDFSRDAGTANYGGIRPGCWLSITLNFENNFTMKRFLFFVLSVCVLTTPAPARAEHEDRIQILLLGDSTAEGSVPRRIRPESILGTQSNWKKDSTC
jgi:hypothetical protein